MRFFFYFGSFYLCHIHSHIELRQYFAHTLTHRQPMVYGVFLSFLCNVYVRTWQALFKLSSRKIKYRRSYSTVSSIRVRPLPNWSRRNFRKFWFLITFSLAPNTISKIRAQIVWIKKIRSSNGFLMKIKLKFICYYSGVRWT